MRLRQLSVPEDSHFDPGGPWDALVGGALDALGYSPRPAAGPPAALFPGAFNPLHTGHLGIAAAAQKILDAEVGFELSISNVDKPVIAPGEVRRRLGQFAPEHSLWLTTAPTFVRKAEIFPGAIFVVGADTITRIADPRYYASDAARDGALRHLAELGCRFLVFGRRVGPVDFRALADLQLPSALRELCTGVAESEFRNDISSSALRRRQPPD